VSGGGATRKPAADADFLVFQSGFKRISVTNFHPLHTPRKKPRRHRVLTLYVQLSLATKHLARCCSHTLCHSVTQTPHSYKHNAQAHPHVQSIHGSHENAANGHSCFSGCVAASPLHITQDAPKRHGAHCGTCYPREATARSEGTRREQPKATSQRSEAVAIRATSIRGGGDRRRQRSEAAAIQASKAGVIRDGAAREAATTKCSPVTSPVMRQRYTFNGS